jgi:DNA-binding response OmpR family regulator
MSRASILVIEDDRHILELLRVCLDREGYRVALEESGLKGLERARREKFDLIILDLMLPEIDGLAICRELSPGSANSTPILILTARGEEADRVLGLKLGADDYVVKPFSPRELTARVEAILRRASRDRVEQCSEPVSCGEIELDPERRLVTVQAQRAPLTPKEFDLLHLLLRHPGRVFTREELMDRVWGYDFAGCSRTVDEHIKNLRQKIKDCGAASQYIHTVWGVGYKCEVAGQ